MEAICKKLLQAGWLREFFFHDTRGLYGIKWTPKGIETLHDAGGDQLLPAVAADGGDDVIVSFSRAKPRSGRIDRLLWRHGRVQVISSAPSYPRNDTFFTGRFIGWNSGSAFFHGRPISVWPDLRRRTQGKTVSAMTALTS